MALNEEYENGRKEYKDKKFYITHELVGSCITFFYSFSWCINFWTFAIIIFTNYSRSRCAAAVPAETETDTFYVLLTVHPWIILQISPNRCTILLNIFISLFYMFRAFMCPSSGKNYCIYATLIFVTLCGWRLVCWLDWNQSNQQTRRHPYSFNPTSRPDAIHTEWQIPMSHRYSTFLLLMGTWMPETCREE